MDCKDIRIRKSQIWQAEFLSAVSLEPELVTGIGTNRLYVDRQIHR